MSDDKINLDDIWPQEREVIFSPHRLKYLRRVVKVENKDCVFCQAEQKEMSLDSLCVYKTKHSMVVLNKFPYNSGHILVLPRGHQGELDELSEESYLDLSQIVRLAVKAVKEVYSCPGVNIGMNHGKVAGAGIPDHLHWHVIPRWAGDTNFFPLIAETKLVPETLEQTYEKLSAYFAKLK